MDRNYQWALRDFWSLQYSAPSAPFFTHHVSQRIGALVAWTCARSGVTVNLLTLSGLPFIILGCFSFAGGVPGPSAVIAFIMLQLAYAIDCADGQLARATSTKSAFGAWLDIAVDHARNVMITVAVMYYLIAIHDLGAIAGLTVAVFGVGSTVSLHAFAELKSGRPTQIDSIPASTTKRLVKTATDTAVVVTVLCLLRPYPKFLMAYLVILGLGNISTTVMLSATRLKTVANGGEHE